MFIYDPAPLSLMFIASGVDIWPKLAQAVVLLQEIQSGTYKSSCLTDLLNGGDLGSTGDHVLIWIGKTGLQRDQEMTKQLYILGRVGSRSSKDVRVLLSL